MFHFPDARSFPCFLFTLATLMNFCPFSQLVCWSGNSKQFYNSSLLSGIPFQLHRYLIIFVLHIFLYKVAGLSVQEKIDFLSYSALALTVFVATWWATTIGNALRTLCSKGFNVFAFVASFLGRKQQEQMQPRKAGEDTFKRGHREDPWGYTWQVWRFKGKF